MSHLDDPVSYARNNVRERERSAAEHRLAHEAVAGAGPRFALMGRLLSLRRRPSAPVEEQLARPEMRHEPR